MSEKTIPKIWLQDNLALKWNWAHDGHAEDLLLVIHQDECPENPRTDYDHTAQMALFHPRYVLGDPAWNGKNPDDFWKAILAGSKDQAALVTEKELELAAANDDRRLTCFELDENDPAAPADQLLDHITDGGYATGIELLGEKALIRPVYLYDHSGLTISVSSAYPYNDRFDSSTIGWVMVTKDDAIGNLGATEKDWLEKANACIEAEIEEYDHYLRGDVWWYQIKRFENGDWEDYEACSGFIGDTIEDSGMLDAIEFNLAESLASGEYRTGEAKPKQVTVWEYSFN